MKYSWNAPPTQPLFLRKDVHIWRAGLDLPGKNIEKLRETLASDERIRADHFRFERDRSRFIAARGILRLIISRYLSVEPGAIRFIYAKEGKPKLQKALGKTGIQFNLSHSEGLALYVFAWNREVGIDIEYMREISQIEQIVEQFFSVRERVLFGALPLREKKETFFNWWTRKEAFIKAVGEGLSYPLWEFDAALAEEKSLDSSTILGGAQEGPGWSMWDVRPADGFTGAVVVKGRGWDVHCWQWPG